MKDSSTAQSFARSHFDENRGVARDGTDGHSVEPFETPRFNAENLVLVGHFLELVIGAEALPPWVMKSRTHPHSSLLRSR